MTDSDDSEQRRHINGLRFNWHEQVLTDAEVRKHPTALAFAGLVMHRFHVGKGCAEISHKSAMKALKMQKTSVLRARNFLIERGWLQIFERRKTAAGAHSAIRYSLAGGPDDLMLDQHVQRDSIDEPNPT